MMNHTPENEDDGPEAESQQSRMSSTSTSFSPASQSQNNHQERRRSSAGRRGHTSLLASTLRRALSVDYMHTNEDEDNGEEEGAQDHSGGSYEDDDGIFFSSSSDPHTGPTLCNNNKCLMVFLVIVVVLLVSSSVFVKQSRKVITPETNSGGGETDEAEEDEVCQDASKLSKLHATEHLQHGAVASDHDICSQMGVRILLEKDGNAVDAAVTTALCLGVVNPSSSGLGGGAFMLIHANFNDNNEKNMPDFVDARSSNNNTDYVIGDRPTEVIDCREQAPSQASQNMYDNLPSNASVYGGLAVSIFSELRCLELAHARFGILSWKTVVEPVADLATAGSTIGAFLGKEIAQFSKKLSNKESMFYGLRRLLTKNDDWNHPLQVGDILKNHELALLLREIANDGPKALYGKAKTLAQEIQDAGGIVQESDIQNYRAVLRSPLVARHVDGHSLVGVPPPSSGGAAVLGAARFLQTGIRRRPPLASTMDTLTRHLIVEACKHVFAIRMSLSDPDYNTATVLDAVQDLVTSSHMEDLRNDHYLENTTLPLSQYGGSKWAQLKDTDGGGQNVSDAHEGDRRKRKGVRKLLRKFGYLNDHGTSHFSVVDRFGNAVAMTTSVNTVFGSLVRSPSTGVLFSNTMDDFAKPGGPDFFGLHPSEANYIKPGKRPLSSMAPTLVFRDQQDGTSSDLRLVIGASGGPKIITAVLQVLLNHVHMGMPLMESIVHPRLHDQLIYHGAAVTTAEQAVLNSGQEIDVSQRTREALLRRGHQLLDVDFSGTVQAIEIDLELDTMSAASDSRKGGAPAGY